MLRLAGFRSCFIARRFLMNTAASQSPTPNFTSADVNKTMLNEYAKQQAWPMSQKQMFDLGANATPDRLLMAAQYMHRELPVRLARMALLLDHMPYTLPQHPFVQHVREAYVESFASLAGVPKPSTAADCSSILLTLKQINERHSYGAYLAQAVQETLGDHKPTDNLHLTHFFDRFYTLRIGVRVLIEHFCALHTPRPGYVGIIEAAWSPAQAAEEVGHYARSVCLEQFGVAPEVVVRGAKDIRLQMISIQMRRIMFALLKNSFVAVLRTHKGKPLPPIEVIISGGSQDVTIKVSDVGGGIPRSAMKNIWSYHYSSGESILPTDDGGQEKPRHMASKRMDKGYGFGLPLSRVCARYFRGDVCVISMEGYGTDAYLYLNKFEEKTERLMPVEESSSSGTLSPLSKS